ncbi:hypothetical protein DH2020_007536 [Rehmannia glutinosa]|uniref:GAGA-binding transcriptional activator n=1 Tax=Rehmannia glutinosa TaxID=99300 RepID=A0ABR0TYI3_REHGL
MDDSGHRENGRHKPPQGQWLMQHQPSMKQIMAIMAERDAAIQERNLALSEKKAALAERDMAILQRDSAIAERNNAIMERDNAIATLQYRENAINNSSNISPCPPVGGRKMSGSAFNKLLSRLAGEGHDLSNPVDLKDHWAKHGTNRYITIK